MKLFVSKGSLSRATLVDELQREHGLIELLIGELGHYLTIVREQLGALGTKSSLGSHVFQEFFPHTEQMTSRMEFMKDLAKYGTIMLKTQ